MRYMVLVYFVPYIECLLLVPYFGF